MDSLRRVGHSASPRNPIGSGQGKGTDVFILANHGLVVCGQDCAATEELLCEVERRSFIEYNGKIKVNKSLLTVVLHE